MQATKDTVVSFHYNLSDEGGAVESSRDREPLTVLLGHGGLIPGMEKGLEGHAKGDQFTISVPPEEGYGVRDPNAVQRLPKKYFRNPEKLRAGDVTVLNTQHGARAVTVLKVGATVIDVDVNHPMAGKTLTFEIEVTDVRAATPEEIEHKHAHGPGGHHH